MNELSASFDFGRDEAVHDEPSAGLVQGRDEADRERPSKPSYPADAPAAGAQRGVFYGFDKTLAPTVSLGARDPQPAISTIPLAESQRGRDVLLLFEHGGEERPIIVGFFPDTPCGALPGNPKPSVDVRLDGDMVVLNAQRQIELRCGEASITLTRAGKVLIRGAYVLSRSKGANKIKGAYVDIN